MLASANRVEVAYHPTNKATGRTLWNQLLATYHYLGFRALVGESIKYVAIMSCSHRVGNSSIVLAETFVAHSRFAGTCYCAAGWMRLGQTRGYGRNAGRYYYRGKSETIYIYPLY